ncbi:MAG: TonB-dependent receptor [Cytophagales bacterium]|nr:TonB-dependent receptor [Cytophagales bacterium]
MTKIRILSVILIFTLFQSVNAQIKISGKVLDNRNKEALVGTNIVIKGTTTGTTTNFNGAFELEVDSLPVTLQISFIGYVKKDLRVTNAAKALNISMEGLAFTGQEVVVTASRVEETIMESPVSIQKINAREIQGAASGDFYQDIGNLQGVDVATASMGFKVINTRGFNTTFNTRSVQFIDGMDNQAPGLQVSVGNLVGASELDLESVELISGPASALYGPNAMQGVVSMTTKNPFDYTGLDVLVKGGTRNLFDGQFRYAQVLDTSLIPSLPSFLNNKLAFKFTGSYMQADDWEAIDTAANRYGDEFLGGDDPLEVDLSSIVAQAQYDTLNFTPDEIDDWIALNNFLGFNRGLFPGKINIPSAPGYMESDLADYSTKSIKAGASLHYKFNDSLKISYDYKFGLGTAIFQATNRFSIKNIQFQQHKLELTGKNFFVRGYTTLENAGDAYDIVFTGIFLSKKSIEDLYVPDYLSEYFDILDTLTNGFESSDDGNWWSEDRQAIIDSAHSAAVSAAANSWYQPGTAQFDSVYNATINIPTRKKDGSKFVDASSLQHFEAQYDFTEMLGNKLNLGLSSIIAGASFRRYNPHSFGTIFSDTLINRSDALESGDIDINSEYVDISTWEYGAYTQISKRFLDNKLKITGSIRFDDHKNYDPQLSPRASAVYTYKDNNFRVAVQSAFRAPTLQNQYLYIDLGALFLEGNLNGSTNYTRGSVDAFNDMFDITKVSLNQWVYNLDHIDSISKATLKIITLAPLQPEHVNSLEIGYRSIFNNDLYVDMTVYYSIYSNFIGNRRVIRPLFSGTGVPTGEDSINAIIAGTSKLYQIPVNAKEDITTYGGSIGISYFFGRGLTAKLNYTYAFMDTSNLGEFIPGFNTPKNKFNVGLQGTSIYKGLGFSVNYKWIEGFSWESSFGDGNVPTYNLLDVQLNYNFSDLHSILRVGASNLLKNSHIEAFGAPAVGRIIYTSWTFSL